MLITLKEKEYLYHLLSKQKKTLFLSKEEKKIIFALLKKIEQTVTNQRINNIRQEDIL